MKENGHPIVFTWTKPADCGFPLVKILVSSATRSLFSGKINIHKIERACPLFRIGRKGVSETRSPLLQDSDLLRSDLLTVIRRAKAVNSVPSHNELQWMVFAHAAGICLRNIDHLFPVADPYGGDSLEIDMLWTKVPSGDNPNGSEPFGFGLIAFRRKHLSLVIDRLVEAEHATNGSDDNKLMLIKALRSLPLQKRTFEKGEVYSPLIGEVDWKLLSNAAFVTIPDWPEKEQWKFLQTLYFGTYFGDETGLMLNILDP